MNDHSKLLDNYQIDPTQLDEVFNTDKSIYPHYQNIISRFNQLSSEDFKKVNETAKLSFFNQGVTFNVYSEKGGVERVFPFDLFPRVIAKDEWQTLERGLIQRNHAINEFLWDIYHQQHILKQGIIPLDLIYRDTCYCKEMIGIDPAGGVYIHVSGTDLIKHKDGSYYVLEDNVRCPSGIGYVLSNREAMKRTFSGLFFNHNIEKVGHYPEQLLEIMQSVSPRPGVAPNCVVLTPGAFNSAYYEHSFLAMSMGIPLVEGRDLFVDQNVVYSKNINGPERVDVIYRRLDDDFMDPLVFNPDSLLGVPGIMGAYRAGNVTLMNAPGTGLADNKAVYIYMPEIINYYLGEEPILNNVKTYRCELKEDFQFVKENMAELVVKPVDESGGYGVLIGNKATKEELDQYLERIAMNPKKYIAQPIMSLSVHPTLIGENDCFEPRHIDLRSFSLMGRDLRYVCQGGLTRVALKKGNLVVNSSQGGGSKDTWVLS